MSAKNLIKQRKNHEQEAKVIPKEKLNSKICQDGSDCDCRGCSDSG